MVDASQKLIKLLNLDSGKPSLKEHLILNFSHFLQEIQKELNLIMDLLLF